MGRANSKKARIASLKGGGFGDAYRKAAAKKAQFTPAPASRTPAPSSATSYAPASSTWTSMVSEARTNNLSDYQFGSSKGKHSGSYSPVKDIAGVAKNGSVAYGKHAAGGPKNTHKGFDWFSR